jgi:DNA polymerase-3 subunit delta
MTVVKSAAADGFIQRMPRDVRFCLVHGSDEGLTHERAKAIVRNALAGDADPLRFTRLEGDAVARAPGALADEAYAVSMFGGSRAIWIDAQSRDLLPALEPLFESPPSDCMIIVKAGQLKKGTALRNAFEKMSNGASIECYADEPKELGSLIDAAMREAGLTIAADARASLQALLGGDRQTTRNELAKLMLYAHGRSRIEAADVEAIVSDAAPSVQDEVIDRALLGDLPAVGAYAARFFYEGGDVQNLMNRLIARLTLLHRLRLEMDQGRPFEAACQAVFVRLPQAARRALGDQAERWTSETIAQQFPAVRAASARVRAEPRLSEFLATRTLWALASRSSARRR